MSTERPIAEEELHAYVDGALGATRHAEVAAYLAQHPDTAARIEAYAQQRQMLRASLMPIAEEPVPPELNLLHLVQARRRPYPVPAWRSVAAALLLLGAGGAGGWYLHGVWPADRTNMTALAQEAADSFRVYGIDPRHAVELHATDTRELAGWVTSSLGHDVAIPDLSGSGYHFMGGRVVPTAHGPAAMYMYSDARGTRIAMLVRPTPVRDTPMSEHLMGQFCGYAWAERGIGYSLVSGASAERLHPLADEIHRQVDQDA